MDRKSVLILLVSFLLIIGWFKLVEVLYPPPPPRAVAQGTNAATGASRQTEPHVGGTKLPTPTLSAPVPGSTLWTAPKAEEAPAKGKKTA